MKEKTWCVWLLLGLLAAACSSMPEDAAPAPSSTPMVIDEAGSSTPVVEPTNTSTATPTEQRPTVMPKATDAEIPADESIEETANMVVTVITTPEVADILSGNGEASPASEALRETLDELGVNMEPMHPGIEVATLKVFYTISVPNIETAQLVINRLLAMPEAIEGAYVTPGDELP